MFISLSALPEMDSAIPHFDSQTNGRLNSLSFVDFDILNYLFCYFFIVFSASDVLLGA